jgi:16S rRNA (cytidine1402-2'-O)-methyltransferase
MDKDRAGELFVVSTPIGNLEDISFRAVRVLSECDVIAAEDTRVTRVLLDHYDIRTPTVSYHAHNAREKAPLLVARMREGQRVSLVSDAGTPLVSDPGEVLVRLAADSGIAVRPVPGASALLAGLVVSGLDASRFVFQGFLPRKDSDCRREIRNLARFPGTLVFYESPRRVSKTIALLAEELGDRPAVLGRELTKVFESVKRGTLFSFRAQGTGEPEKGEWVLLIGGCPDAPGGEGLLSSTEVLSALEGLSLTPGDRARLLSRLSGLSRKDAYRLASGVEPS